MRRMPTLDEIFSEPDEYGLLKVKPKQSRGGDSSHSLSVVHDVSAFYERTGRLPDPDAIDSEEMRLGEIWRVLAASPSRDLVEADRLGLFRIQAPQVKRDWRDEPDEIDIPDSLDAILDDEELNVDIGLLTQRHTTPSIRRSLPDHHAEFSVCRNFEAFEDVFKKMQEALDLGERKASPIRSRSIIEPIEGDFFIRGGLLALVAEKSEMSIRGGSRDHRLRVVFSNGMESDPLMSSFRKSLNEDKTARKIDPLAPGPLFPEWEADRLNHSGTVYVARSLSSDPLISDRRGILHKIGVTSQDVFKRVADARNDPTFLLAPVEIVATYELRNLPRRKVEDLLHRFFDEARFSDLRVSDRFGKGVRPKEWFFVLPDHVGQAAKLIQDGSLHEFRYDVATQRIVQK